MKLRLNKFRRMVLTEGIPDDDTQLRREGREGGGGGGGGGVCSLRGQIWKLLLQVPSYNPEEYIGLIQSEEGDPEIDKKIRNDSFRTLTSDKDFSERVKEEQLIRVLKAFALKASREKGGKFQYSYVQGMNCLVAPFLYVLPEADAFFAFDLFLRKTIPVYVQPFLDGVHSGVKLVDEILKMEDPELFGFLEKNHLHAKIYAFPSILTLCCSTPPLREVLKLWDFFFAFGPGMVVPCVVVQITAIREEIMRAESPNNYLRNLPNLNARKIINDCMSLIKKIPPDVYDKLVKHPLDPTS